MNTLRSYVYFVMLVVVLIAVAVILNGAQRMQHMMCPFEASEFGNFNVTLPNDAGYHCNFDENSAELTVGWDDSRLVARVIYGEFENIGGSYNVDYDLVFAIYEFIDTTPSWRLDINYIVRYEGYSHEADVPEILPGAFKFGEVLLNFGVG